MLRIHFTAHDLARVTIAHEPDSALEVLLSRQHPRGALHPNIPADLRPYWPSIRRHIAADRARRVAQLGELGVDHVLAHLHPAVQWEPPVLHIKHTATRDLLLDGYGLLLQPSFFSRQAHIQHRELGLPPVLIYPTQPPPGTLQHHQNPSPTSLESLIGRTRAVALEATVAGCTTSALARVCGISVGAASQQATVLRDASLITSRRTGLAVLHEITPLGLKLLSATTVRA